MNDISAPNANAHAIKGNANEVPSLLIPVLGRQLILPTVSVAEMLPFRKPSVSSIDAQAPWYMGQVLWRGVKIPMVSYEALTGESIAEVRGISQMAVLNSTGTDSRLPFLCFPTQGIPRLSRVTPENSQTDASKSLSEYDQMHINVADVEATIPDLVKMEQAVVNLLLNN